MNRKQLVIGGIVVAIALVLCVTVSVALWLRSTDHTPKMGGRKPVSELTYCNDDQVRPCVVSFGVDSAGNMLVNILVPDLSGLDYYLKITREGTDETSIYECSRVKSSLNSIYCIGGKMPPGEPLHLFLISTKDDTLLAKGDLTIIALALPTLEVSTSTPGASPIETAPPATEAPPDFIFPTPTETEPSYPNPPYP